MVAMLGRPWARRTTSSGSRPCFLAQVFHTRATAGVESTSTPSISKSRARHRISIAIMIISLRARGRVKNERCRDTWGDAISEEDLRDEPGCREGRKFECYFFSV